MAKQSVKAAARDAIRADAKARKAMLPPDGSGLSAPTLDSFVNMAHKLGIGADNPLTSSTYGFNPITRNRTLLEWIHRGSWLGGIAIDTIADDMTREGVEAFNDLPPDANERIEAHVTRLRIWEQLNEVIKWGRLYGGAIAVALVDGQDVRQPLRRDIVGPGQFKGLLVLDRWMLEPTLDDLVTDFGPDLGMPKYYRVGPNAPALRGQAIHHSRVMVRHTGVQVPYQQRLTEQLWGISVLERLYDRMVAFDSASTGAAQLVYKSYLRTIKVDGLRDIVAAGGAPMKGLYAYVDVMRRFQGIEGITMLDKNDEFDTQQHSAFSGLDSALSQFAQQLSGALEIPLVRLFGQSPSGFSTGDTDLRNYYDKIKQQQERELYSGVTAVYEMTARSLGIAVPPNFGVEFSALWQMTDKEKADTAQVVSTSVDKAVEGGLIGRRTALKELRSSSRVTGIFTNITDETIAAADDEVAPPGLEALGALGGLPGMPGLPGMDNDPPGDQDENGQKGPPSGLADGPRRRVQLHQPPTPGGPPNRPTGQGVQGRPPGQRGQD